MDPQPRSCENDANFKIDVPLDHILHPSSARHELEQLMRVSGNWEMSGCATEAGLGVKVGVLALLRGVELLCQLQPAKMNHRSGGY